MSLLEELTRSLDYDCPVKDIRQGVLHTAVVTRHCGLAATFWKKYQGTGRLGPFAKPA